MLFVNIGLMSLFLIVFIFAEREKEAWMLEVDKKEHRLYKLYPVSHYLLKKLKADNYLYQRDVLKDALKTLYQKEKAQDQQKLYGCGKLAMVIFVVLVFNLMSMVSLLSNNNSVVLREGYQLQRPQIGQAIREIALTVSLIPKNATDHSGRPEYSQDINLRLEARRYSEEEIKELFQTARDYLDKCLLGSNESADHIVSDLNFIKEIPGTGITIRWKPESYSLIGSDGRVYNEGIAPKGELTSVIAILKYYEAEQHYQKMLRIMPKKLNEEEYRNKALKEKVQEASKQTEREHSLKLPTTLDSYHLSWKIKKKDNSLLLMLMGVFASIIAWVNKDRMLEEKLKKRSKQMLLDYPELINKFTLLINAGMTVKQAWYKMVYDYDRKHLKDVKKSRFAYEEMAITMHELQLGVPEGIAYDNFGRRAGLLPYMKFSALITQNLKKGNKGLSELLYREGLEAFEERKQIARRQGEEAGTKLLLPMGVMLVIVFVIILIPAFMSFHI